MLINTSSMSRLINQKNPRAHKNKIGTSTPSPSKKAQNPPSEENVMGVGGFPAERTKHSQAPIKIGAAISGPRIAGGKIMDMRIFLNKASYNLPRPTIYWVRPPPLLKKTEESILSFLSLVGCWVSLIHLKHGISLVSL